MPITIGKNIASLQATRRLNQSSATLSGVFERLSSGMRINHASDDAAGLSVSSMLTASARVTAQAIRNANDGVSLLNNAEGGILQLETIAQRQRELATQSANGTLSAKQRTALQAESTALTNEYNRIIATTQFNNVAVLSGGTVTIEAGVGAGAALTIDIASALGAATSAPSGVSADLGTAQVVTMNITGQVGQDSIFNLSTPAASQISGGDWIDIQAVIDNGLGSSFYFWFTVDGAGSDPGSIGYGIQVDLSSSDNSSTVLSKIQAAGVVLAGSVSISGSQFTIFGHAPSGISSTNGNFGITQIQTFAGDLLSAGDAITLYDSQNSSWQFYTYSSTTGIGGVHGTPDHSIGLDTGTQNYFNSITTAVSNYLAAINGTGAFSATASGGVITISNLLSGVASAPVSAPTGYPSASVQAAGTAGNLNVSTDQIGISNHGLSTGQAVTITSTGAMPGGLTSGNTYYVIKIDNNTIRLATSLANAMSSTAINLTSTGHGSLFLATGGTTTSSSAYMSQLDITTAAGARSALDSLGTTERYVGAALTAVGSLQSRLQTRIATLSAFREAQIGAAARITDADIASDSSILVRENIRQQAASAVLAQANQLPALALKLLRGD